MSPGQNSVHPHPVNSPDLCHRVRTAQSTVHPHPVIPADSNTLTAAPRCEVDHPQQHGRLAACLPMTVYRPSAAPALKIHAGVWRARPGHWSETGCTEPPAARARAQPRTRRSVTSTQRAAPVPRSATATANTDHAPSGWCFPGWCTTSNWCSNFRCLETVTLQSDKKRHVSRSTNVCLLPFIDDKYSTLS